MQTVRVGYIELAYQRVAAREIGQLLMHDEGGDESLITSAFEIVHALMQSRLEIYRRVSEYKARKQLPEDYIEVEGLGVYEDLLTQGGVQVLPQATVVIGDVESALQLVIGTTVAKVRELCGVPADMQGVVDDQPVADNYLIVRDCRLVFQPSREKLAAIMCGAIRAQGYCQQREDSHDWISFNDWWRIIPPDLRGRLRTPKKCHHFFKKEGIRTRNPSPQRLLVHGGDWAQYLVHRAQQQEKALAAAKDPEEITSMTGEMKAIYEVFHTRKQDGK